MCRGRVARLDDRGRGHVRDWGGARLGLVTARDGLTINVVQGSGTTDHGIGWPVELEKAGGRDRGATSAKRAAGGRSDLGSGVTVR